MSILPEGDSECPATVPPPPPSGGVPTNGSMSRDVLEELVDALGAQVGTLHQRVESTNSLIVQHMADCVLDRNALAEKREKEQVETSKKLDDIKLLLEGILKRLPTPVEPEKTQATT